MFKTKSRILLLIAIIFFLIIYPYTKEVKIFRAEDANWDILNHTKKYKEFDTRTFVLTQTYNFPEEVLNLEGKQINIKGFIKKEKHSGHVDVLLTETVTEVCFMCNHDEHYNVILLKPNTKDSELFNVKDDALVQVKGKFKIEEGKGIHSVYILENVELEAVINEN